MAKIIDGKKISAEIKEELKTEVAAYAAPVSYTHLYCKNASYAKQGFKLGGRYEENLICSIRMCSFY